MRYFLLAVMLACASLLAQTPRAPKVPKEFKSQEWTLPLYRATADGIELQATCAGTNATPLSADEILVQQFEMKSFREKAVKEPQLITQAPSCRLHVTNQTASSSGPLQVFTPNTNFFIEGNGFFCSQKESSIVISNDVQTKFVKLLLKSPTLVTNELGIGSGQVLRIFADRFQLQYESNLVTYLGNVRVIDADMQLRSDRLTGHYATNGSIEWIRAEQNVVVTSTNQGRATGDQAYYIATAGQESIELIGRAVWHDGEREATAGKFAFTPATRVLTGSTNVHISFPNQQFARSEMLESAKTNATPSADRVSELFAGFVTISLPPDKGPVKSFRAEQNVVITNRFQGSGVSAGTALYTQTNDTLELTGNPVWRSEQAEVTGQVLTAIASNRVFSAKGNARLRLKMNSTTASNQPGLPLANTAVSNQVLQIDSREINFQTNVATFQDNVRAELLDPVNLMGSMNCASLKVHVATNNQVEKLFARGWVRAQTAPDPAGIYRTLNCESLTVLRSPATGLFKDIKSEGSVALEQLGPGQERKSLDASTIGLFFSPITNQLERIVAEGNVFGMQLTSKGETNQISGGKMVYTFGTNEIVRISDQPRAIVSVPAKEPGKSPGDTVPGTDAKMTRPTRVLVSDSEALYYEPKSGRCRGEGEYKISPIYDQNSLSSPR